MDSQICQNSCPSELPTILVKNADWTNFEFHYYGLLESYFASAFTLLVYRRGLCPKQGFKIITKWGIQVPSFTIPSSIQYVDEVSRKIVYFMKMNVLEGAVLHVILTKDKIPRTIEKYVFHPLGCFEPEELELLDRDRQTMILNSVISQCSTSLQEMQADNSIAKINCPWYSRWTVSLGLKKEFIDMSGGPDGVFARDPTAFYFPWKKRPRLGRRVVKIEIPSCIWNSDDSVQTLKETTSSEEEKITEVPASPDTLLNGDNAYLDLLLNTAASCGVDFLHNPLPPVEEGSDNFIDFAKLLSAQDEEEMDTETVDSETGTEDVSTDTDSVDFSDPNLNPMHPISSFQVIRGLTINWYRVVCPSDISEEMDKRSKTRLCDFLSEQEDNTTMCEDEDW